MIRKNNNRNNMKHRGNNNGGRRFQNNGGGGSRHNDGQNLARQKHHATQQREKYSNMARDAQNNGDRVDVEYYLQHVDHYTRVLTDIAAIEAERHQHFRDQQPQQTSGDTTEGETNTESDVPAEAASISEAELVPQAPVQSSQGRGPRHRRQHTPQQASDNGAAEANANTHEIPLPGSILPPI